MTHDDVSFTHRAEADGIHTFTHEPGAIPWDVEITVARLPNGTYKPVGIALTPRPGRLSEAVITVDTLRHVPLRRLVAAAVEAALGDPEAALRRWRTTSPRDPDHLQAVAEVYREAAARGRALDGGPRGAVRKAWSVSEKTADRWIRAARDAGKLEPYHSRDFSQSSRYGVDRGEAEEGR